MWPSPQIAPSLTSKIPSLNDEAAADKLPQGRAEEQGLLDVVDMWENPCPGGGLNLGIHKSQAQPTSHSLPERFNLSDQEMGVEPQLSREREVNTSCSGAPTTGPLSP